MHKYSYIFLITAISTLCEVFKYRQTGQSRDLLRIVLMSISSLLTFYFIKTQFIWLGFILWELISILSTLLVLDFDQKKIIKSMNVLLISLLSGGCFLFTIYKLPFNATFINNYDFISQIGLCFAIVIKSGLVPFLWPQFASIATYNVSALLHAATAIQLGLFLCIKTNLFIYDTPILLFKIFGYGTFIWGFFYLILQKNLKSNLACLTQCTNAAILINLSSGLPIGSMIELIAYHGLYKSTMFAALEGKNSFGSIILLFAAILSLFFGPAQLPNKLAKLYMICFIFKVILATKWHELREFKIEFEKLILCIPLFILSTYKLHLFKLDYWIILPIVQILLSFVKFRHYNLAEHESKFHKIINLSKILFVSLIIFIFIYHNFNWTNIFILLKSHLQVITLVPFGFGMYFLFRAKSKIEFVVALNLISATVAILLFENGGIEICATHIISDVVVTIFLLRSDIELYNKQTREFLWIIPLLIFVLAFTHKQSVNDLVFPIAHGLNQLNEVVVNWRLLDTLGEILVFSLVRFAI